MTHPTSHTRPGHSVSCKFGQVKPNFSPKVTVGCTPDWLEVLVAWAKRGQREDGETGREFLRKNTSLFHTCKCKVHLDISHFALICMKGKRRGHLEIGSGAQKLGLRIKFWGFSIKVKVGSMVVLCVTISSSTYILIYIYACPYITTFFYIQGESPIFSHNSIPSYLPSYQLLTFSLQACSNFPYL